MKKTILTSLAVAVFAVASMAQLTYETIDWNTVKSDPALSQVLQDVYAGVSSTLNYDQRLETIAAPFTEAERNELISTFKKMGVAYNENGTPFKPTAEVEQVYQSIHTKYYNTIYTAQKPLIDEYQKLFEVSIVEALSKIKSNAKLMK